MSEREYICLKHDSSACNDCVNDMRVLESALRAKIEKLTGALRRLSTWPTKTMLQNARQLILKARQVALNALAEASQ